MKLALGIALIIWLGCGLVGAWMFDDLDRHHLKMIAKGPITLAQALDEHPVTYGPN
jgi:hypothetical protein